MSKSITIADELYKEFASYGNRDESHNTILARLLEHSDKEELEKDRKNRITEYNQEGEDTDSARTYPVVEELEDGTVVRWKITRGDYAGGERTGKVSGGRIAYDGGTWSPTGMAREADQDIRGSDARNSGSYNGPREVEYQNDDGKWVPLQTVLEE
jgi:predicted CopG family antitoxin